MPLEALDSATGQPRMRALIELLAHLSHGEHPRKQLPNVAPCENCIGPSALRGLTPHCREPEHERRKLSRPDGSPPN